MDKECNLDDLKEKYSEIQNKYDLPDFDSLNEDFSIERISEIETDFLLREIRKFLSEKFTNYLRFIEAIIHPVSSPLFIFSVIKILGAEEKEKLTEIYKVLAKKEIKLVELDISYDEKKEAFFLKESFESWKKIKKDLLEVFQVIDKNWDNKFETNNKGYFG
jgi:hypothetical protein